MFQSKSLCTVLIMMQYHSSFNEIFHLSQFSKRLLSQLLTLNPENLENTMDFKAGVSPDASYLLKSGRNGRGRRGKNASL